LEKIARKNYSKIPALVDIPNLLDVQLESYKNFILSTGKDKPGESLQSVFETIFPIVSARENFVLEYISYSIGEPKYSVDECQERDLTFAAPLKAKLRLIIKVDEEGERKVKDVMEAEVFLGELPLITDKGTFIINGAERVIVSQLHRSPGVFFSDTQHPNGKRLFSARIIPYRGSWVEFTTDINDVMYVHIDRKRKQPATILLRAVGFDTDAKILQLFFKTEDVSVTKRASKTDQSLIGRYTAEDVFNPGTGEVVLEAGHEITEEMLTRMRTAGIEQVKVMAEGEYAENDIVRNTLRRDPTKTEEDALKKIYNLLRPGDPPSVETARALLDRLFFNPRRYNLSSVGRYKMNQRLHLNIPLENATLTPTDFVAVIASLLDLANQDGEVDDIDHLGNRRIRSVGELLANQFSLGLSRMARIIRERMSLQDAESITPYDLVNARTISAVIQSFFGSSQLSQFMDQTNPLAELTHKRRLSALGPGGLTRERAGFEVRDVHHTHYGRMCPIETPEGPNIGLITSLATFARVNRFGFLETPYRKVQEGQASQDVVFLSADEEDQFLIAQANEPLKHDGKFVRERVPVRYHDDFPLVAPDQVQYMDVSPMQPVSAAAALIPVPRARRREPRPHGLQHAAPGSAAPAHRAAARRAPASRRRSPAIRVRSSSPSVPARSRASPPTACWCSTRAAATRSSKTSPVWAGSTSTSCRSTAAPTRTRASTRSRWSAPGRRSRRATSSPTVPRPSTASWRSATTSSSPSCRGAATTSRTPSSSASRW
jgi:DNA-directed RNA polymerase subunit beta